MCACKSNCAPYIQSVGTAYGDSGFSFVILCTMYVEDVRPHSGWCVLPQEATMDCLYSALLNATTLKTTAGLLYHRCTAGDAGLEWQS